MTSLNDLMEFDHVVYSDGRGNVTDNLVSFRTYAPQPYVDLDAEGQMTTLGVEGIHDLGEWALLNGFSGQDRYGGPIMHPSEFVGGGLERYIRENAGFYVVVEVTGIKEFSEDAEIDGEMECVGWAVAYKEG